MEPLTQYKNRTIPPVLIALTLACFVFSPAARAVCQEGCLTDQNTVLGDDTLLNNTGPNNTAIGNSSLNSNTEGSDNTATGASALSSNTTGIENTAIGSNTLGSNTTGMRNTASGVNALASNTTGTDNTAIGFNALPSGINDTATGAFSLSFNTTGAGNTANGEEALFLNTTGSSNTAIGFSALAFNSDGSNNTALGSDAGINRRRGSNNIDIGNQGKPHENGAIRIGTVRMQTSVYIAGISGATIPTGVPVIIDADGHLGTTTSSGRFKDAIAPMDEASEAILALKPVTFRYKHELDPAGIPQFGLVAEDVEKVNPDLVTHDVDGKACTVRYEAVNAMLLNEFLKEHRRVQELEKQIEKLAADVQKVSDRAEMNSPPPRTVLNNQ